MTSATATATATPTLARPLSTAEPERRPSVPRLTGLEIRKSLSTRSGRTLVGTAAVLPAVGISLVFALGQDVPGAAEMLGLLGTLVAMLMVAVGVLSTAGEWTHGTVQTTFLAVPRPSRVLLAKYAGMAVLGGVIATIVVGSTFAVAAVAAGPAFTWTGAGVAVIATIGAGAAMTVVGAGIGAAVANAPAALTGTYVMLLVVINVLHGVKPAWAQKIDPLQATADLISGAGSAATPIAIVAGWVLHRSGRCGGDPPPRHLLTDARRPRAGVPDFPGAPARDASARVRLVR